MSGPRASVVGMRGLRGVGDSYMQNARRARGIGQVWDQEDDLYRKRRGVGQVFTPGSGPGRSSQSSSRTGAPATTKAPCTDCAGDAAALTVPERLGALVPARWWLTPTWLLVATLVGMVLFRGLKGAALGFVAGWVVRWAMQRERP